MASEPSQAATGRRIPLWLDCDPGHDDAFAILLAAHHPSLRLLGISTVHGNASLERTTANAGSVLTAIGRPDVPVYPGSAKPFCRRPLYAPIIHGESGLDGTSLLPAPTSPPIAGANAILAMREGLLSQPPNTAWLVATGTLTNVALLFATFPEVAAHVRGLSVMGGAVGGGFTSAQMGSIAGEGERIGNVTAWAEFNIYCDPEAAASVFGSEVLAQKTILVPLDLTHLVLATPAVQDVLLHGPRAPAPCPGPGPSPLRRMLHELLTFFAATYAAVFGITVGPPLHDPVAVAVILQAEGIEHLGFDEGGGDRYRIRAVTDGAHAADTLAADGQVGRTAASKLPPGRAGVRIPTGIDVQAFWACLERCVVRADEASPMGKRTQTTEEGLA